MKTNEEIIAAYKEFGSVWKAGKHLGIAGQSVHERLRACGYKLSGSTWNEEELEELKRLANSMTIAEIASRLGRPYNGVALKISRLGIGQRYGNKQVKRIPRTGQYLKEKITGYIRELDASGDKVTTYAKANGLDIEALANAIQRYYPDWWNAYAKRNAVKPKTECEYCKTPFYPLSHRQIYCNRKCANESRVDAGYFGGKRRNTIGLAEATCQLCGRQNVKGLSSHHVKGKENDPENDYLIALCPGCHQIVTILGGRNFAATPEIWESLIQLVLLRKNGHNPDFMGVFCSVDIEFITEGNKEDYL